MNAHELYECVKLWPAKARPACVTGWIRGCYVEVRAAEQGDKPHCVHAWMLPDDAIALHVASGLEWLNVEGQSVDFRKDGDGVWLGIALSYASKHLVYRGPTLFEAIHKAILATKESA